MKVWFVLQNFDYRDRIIRSITPTTDISLQIKGKILEYNLLIDWFPKIQNKGIIPSIPVKKSIIKHQSYEVNEKPDFK